MDPLFGANISPGRMAKPPIRILHVITDLATGGAQIMLLKLLSAASRDFMPEIVALKSGGALGPEISRLGIPVHTLNMRGFLDAPLAVFRTKSLLRQFHPHVVQGWMYHANLLASLAAGSSPKAAPVLWNVRQSLENMGGYKRKTGAVIRLGAWLSNRAAAIIYNSRCGAMHHANFGFRNKRQVVIPNGFDCDLFHPDQDAKIQVRRELGVSSDALLVGLVGRYDPIKDHRGFLQAAAMVAQKHSDVFFVLAGRGVVKDQPELSEIISRESLQNRVFLLGERPDLARLTAAFDIACSSSWSEGFSNAIGEAMACGVPCVVTDVGDSAYIIGDTGITVPASTPQALAKGIAQLIAADPSGRSKLGAAARNRVMTEFSLPSIAGQYEQLYVDLLEGKCSYSTQQPV